MPLLHTAIALTIDLNLHKESTKSPLTGKRMPQISHEEQRSRNRSMLGCYYLASAYVKLHTEFLLLTDFSLEFRLVFTDRMCSNSVITW